MTIDKLPSGTYRARVYIGKDPGGKKIYKSITDSDKRRLKRKAAALEAESIQPVGGSMTAGQAIKEYIASRKPVLSPSTINGYVQIAGNLEKTEPVLWSARCELIDIQPYINKWHDDGLSYKTIANNVSLIRCAVTCSGYTVAPYRMPAKLHTEYYIPSEENVKTLVTAVKGTRIEVPVTLGIFGLRRSEICAIRASDLDGTTLHIARALVKSSDGGFENKQPKTFNSDRYVSIPPETAASIRRNGYAWGATPDALTSAFAHVLKNAGLPSFRFHDLRHFFVSYCHNILKLSDKQIETLGGWRSDYVMRSHYMHSMRDKETAATVEKSLSFFMTSVTSGVTSTASKTR